MAAANGITEQWQCGKTIIESLSYLLGKEVSCDITFLLGDTKTEIKAHKILLIARSPVFDTMFADGPMKEKDLIEIPDVDADTFKIFLKFVYTDMVDVTNDNVMSIMYVAKKYWVDSLSRKCTEFLIPNISDDNLFMLYEHAHVYDEKALQEACFTHINKSAKKFLMDENFKDLSSACCNSVISSDKLLVKEEFVYDAMLRWSDAECQRQHLEVTDGNRRKVLGSMLYKIRFPLIDKEYFNNNIMNRDFLSDEDKQFMVENQSDISDNTESIFSKKKRINYETIHRFKLTKHPNRPNGVWRYTGQPDRICFRIAGRGHVALHGVVLYGDQKGSVFTFKLEIIDEEEKVLSTLDGDYTGDLSSPTTDILLTEPIRIRKNRGYEVKALISGPSSSYGENRQENISIKDSAITFSNASFPNNDNTIYRGQIPALLLS